MINTNRGTRSNSSLRSIFKDRAESGSTIVTVTTFMVSIFAFASLSLDVANVLSEQRKENVATDAGALAGVAKLPDASAAIQEAVVLAGANGVKTNEIQNAGTVEVGNWSNSTFTVNATPFNAVRVPARRNVPLNFAGVVGMRAMNPAIHSVAALTPAGQANNVIPYAVTVDMLTLVHAQVGSYMTLNDPTVGAGKQGPVDLGVFEPTGSYQNNHAWLADMTTAGCNCAVSVGSVPPETGNDQVTTGIAQIGLNSVVVIPVVSSFDFSGNSGTPTIIGFVRVTLTSYAGKGKNLTATVRFEDATTIGSGGGGSCPPPCAQARALVQ